MPRAFWLIVIFSAIIGGRLHAQPSAQQVDRFFNDVYFKFNPTIGTSSGFHQYDALLEDYSKAAVNAQIRSLHSAEKVFSALPADPDRDLILNYIRATLLDLEQVRTWEKNPDIYSSGVTNSIFVIMSRTFAPPGDRLQSVIARERQFPAAFEAARANLKNPPRIYTEIAIEQLPGIVSFFQNDVPAAFKQVTDAKLLAEFQQSNAKAIDVLKRYQDFLKNDLLARSAGDFRIGAELFHKKLLYEEMVDLPLDKLLEIGMADLRRNQQAFSKPRPKSIPPRPRNRFWMRLLTTIPRPIVCCNRFAMSWVD
jgi:hypothetical protein